MRRAKRLIVFALVAALAGAWSGFVSAQDTDSQRADDLRTRIEVLSDLLEAARSELSDLEASSPTPEYPVPDAIVALSNEPAFFQDRVLPILQNNCFECHGAERQRSELRLDSRESILIGGEHGPAIVPGKPGQSRLVENINRFDDKKMPPEDDLTDEQIAILTAWVAAGAPWPDGVYTPEPATDAHSEVGPAADTREVPLAKFAIRTGKPVSYNRDVRPILSDNCYECHGPDAKVRKADMRLDSQDGLYGKLPSANTPIVPGSLEESQLFQRIAAADPIDRMPPPEHDKHLSTEQIELIGRWILQGAEWQPHWSFIPPKRPELPQVAKKSWPNNPIDHFVLKRLEEEGLSPSPEANRRTLIRRVTLDLTGLPPTPEDVRAFVDDDSPNAYEKVVDRLVASPHYGEHMARYWLDAARYADTNGYHIDNERYMWRWRDWVIEAFNRNLPFDQFTIEQLAGDLLPNPTLDQRIATGFNRNHMINFEGGAIPEEYRVQYVADRVETTATTWMALTVNCAQCHDHKFDPIAQKEFYQLGAFFNSIPEQGLDGQEGNAAPTIEAPLPHQAERLAELRERIESIQARLDAPDDKLDAQQRRWEEEWAARLDEKWRVLEPVSVSSTGGATFTALADGSTLVGGANPDADTIEFVTEGHFSKITALRLEAFTDESLPNGSVGRSENGNFLLTEFEVMMYAGDATDGTPIKFVQAYADHEQKDTSIAQTIDGNGQTGWSAEGMNLQEDRTAYFIPDGPFGAGENTRLVIRLRHESPYPKRVIGRFRLSVTDAPAMTPSTMGMWYVNGPYVAESGEAAYDEAYGPEDGIDLAATYADGRKRWVRAIPGYPDGEVHTLDGEVAATYLYRTIQAPTARKATLSIGSNDAVKIWLNGEVVHDNNVPRSLEKDQDRVEVDLRDGKNELLMKVVNYGNTYAFYFKLAKEELGELPFGIEVAVAQPEERRNESETRAVREYFRRTHSPEWRAEAEKLAALERQREAVEAEVPVVMVMEELDDPRETFVLERGQYDRPGEKVERDTPDALPPFPEDAPRNRLGFAKWLVDPEHPLTARVAVNRLWQRFFGMGIVKTTEDFGAQGEWPSHPELLDWLATEFVRLGWDLKEMQKTIVMSATYRQSSKHRPELNERDPENRLMARGPRYRLEAEMIRDNALAISGLLVEEIGGPSVKPYQPPGLWKEVAYQSTRFTASIFEPDEGEARYRRSLYTFWKRTSPPPNLMIFDAPNRETCTVQRSRSNTPLQALTLMNDPQFVEASRAFAERVLREAGPDREARIARAFELATARPPSAEQQSVLQNLLEDQLDTYRNDEAAARALLGVGADPVNSELDPSELAAYTVVANVILNLDETITKS